MSIDLYKKAANAIKNAEYLTITAGAGMGVDSGLPDFRGNKGFWNFYKEFKGKFSFSDCANPAFLHNHPYNFWGFYGHRLDLYRKTIPHEGFNILLEFAKRSNIKDYFVVTSNVDGQFQKAGFPDNRVYEVHGSIHYTQCTGCSQVDSADPISVNVSLETFESDEIPKCSCQRKQALRPNILMFGDYEWESTRYDIQEREFQNYRFKRGYSNEVIIELGAGLAVPTIRYLSESSFEESNSCTFIRINPRDLKLGYASQSEEYIPIPKGSLEGLQEIKNQL